MTDNKDDIIKCSRSQISFISPVISKILKSDPTVNRFRFKTPGSSNCSGFLRSLMKGEPITVKYDMVKTFRLISLEMENEEVFSFVEENLTTDNVFDIVKYKHKKSFNIENEIKFIASNFFRFDPKIMSNLDFSIIYIVLSSESLVVLSEHKLFDLICDLITSCGYEYLILLPHLHLEYLNLEGIDRFFKLIEDSDAKCFLPCLHRLIVCSQSMYKPEMNDKRFRIVSVHFKNEKFDGIFTYLTKEIGGNPVNKGIIRIEETTNHH